MVVSDKSLPRERFDLEPRKLLAGQGTFRLLNLPLEHIHLAEVVDNIGADILLVLLDTVINDPVVEVFTTKILA